MALKACELIERIKRRFESLDCRHRAGPPKITRRDSRQQIKADIGRRSAVGDRGLRIFLKIIGRQEIVSRGHEGLEKAPGAARDEAQVARRDIRQLILPREARRTARPPGEGGRDQP